MNVGVAHSEVNPNTRVMNSRGIWLTYALGVGILHVVLLSIPFFSVPVVWTLTNVIHNFGMYVFMHAVKGTPFETPDQGKARLLTHWEQLDYGVQFTSSRKFFTISPIILYFLASFYTKYDTTHFVINTASLLSVLIPKLPQLHRTVKILALLAQHSFVNLKVMVQIFLRVDFISGPCSPVSRGSAVEDPTYPGVYQRHGAHDTRFSGHVKVVPGAYVRLSAPLCTRNALTGEQRVDVDHFHVWCVTDEAHEDFQRMRAVLLPDRPHPLDVLKAIQRVQAAQLPEKPRCLFLVDNGCSKRLDQLDVLRLLI
ncbi:hypothetical protein FQN60_001564 [Etheostoma spectabile]|uniref:Uncharacterized protein n=2 Tax=Clupeocephala TaxID=186625 RepID=A0A5J5D607_9PERO|nr:hypothetical protein FQN60_001564 [Etheostoma spectabile]